MGQAPPQPPARACFSRRPTRSAASALCLATRRRAALARGSRGEPTSPRARSQAAAGDYLVTTNTEQDVLECYFCIAAIAGAETACSAYACMFLLISATRSGWARAHVTTEASVSKAWSRAVRM